MNNSLKGISSVLLILLFVMLPPRTTHAFPLGEGRFGLSVFGDTDGDLVQDRLDAFPADPAESIDSDNDGVGNNSDLFPNLASEQVDRDGDGFGDNADVFPDDPTESSDSDSDGVGDNADAFPLISLGLLTDTDGDGYPNDCNQDCLDAGMTGDLDDDNDGVSDLDDAFPLNAEDGSVLEIGVFDIDGDGESKPLTDGLLLIRYLFGFTGDSLISGAIGTAATRDTAEAVETFIEKRVPTAS